MNEEFGGFAVMQQLSLGSSSIESYSNRRFIRGYYASGWGCPNANRPLLCFPKSHLEAVVYQ